MAGLDCLGVTATDPEATSELAGQLRAMRLGQRCYRKSREAPVDFELDIRDEGQKLVQSDAKFQGGQAAVML